MTLSDVTSLCFFILRFIFELAAVIEWTLDQAYGHILVGCCSYEPKRFFVVYKPREEGRSWQVQWTSLPTASPALLNSTIACADSYIIIASICGKLHIYQIISDEGLSTPRRNSFSTESLNHTTTCQASLPISFCSLYSLPLKPCEHLYQLSVSPELGLPFRYLACIHSKVTFL